MAASDAPWLIRGNYMFKVFVQKEGTENPIGSFWGDPIDSF